MTEHNVSTLRSASALRVREQELWQRPLTIALLMLGSTSNACLSDIEISECAKHGTCGVAGASGANGVGGSTSNTVAGVGNDVGSAGEAGEDNAGNGGEAGNVGGTGAGVNGGDGGHSGVAGNGGTDGGTSGSCGASPGGETSGGAGASGGAGLPGSCNGTVDDIASSRSGCPKVARVPLPAPCATSSYSVALHARGGTPPYAWQVSAPSEGWQANVSESDTSVASLTNAHPNAGKVEITLTDALGNRDQASYDLTPRTSCWFAYTAGTTAGATLEIVDPILEKASPIAPQHNHDVYDFAFSPNGKYLSYRFGIDADHEKGRYLALIDLTSWTEQRLTLSDDANSPSDSVTAYAWSADSSVLAVAFTRPGSTYLGGVRIDAGGQLDTLTARETTVSSDLYWVGLDVVAYYANGIIDYGSGSPELVPYDGFATGYYSELGNQGFAKAVLTSDFVYQLPVFVQSASDGFFLDSPSWPQLAFNWIAPNGPFVVDHIGRIVSPSGHFTAAATSAALKLYRAEHRDPIASNASDRDCPDLLTWAEGRERFACLRDVPVDPQGKKHSELRIFDLADDESLTVAPVQGYCVKDTNAPSTTDPCAAKEYDYTTARSNLQPRIFSKTGDWLAFTPSPTAPNASYIYLADLRAKPFGLKSKLAFNTTQASPNSTAKLAFSPNEQLLLGQLGGNLTVFSVPRDGLFVLENFDAQAPDSNPICSEDYASAPDRWCGSAKRSAPFAWAPNSQSVAYRSRSATGEPTLTVVAFARSDDGSPRLDAGSDGGHTFPSPVCGTKCSGQFAFQP
ncbi:MAG TPA: hypothetical protein VER96_37215 [Polyangiaceae bacterium]|nr:hypothetical protein [Polyangiaceae bacterium]